LRKRLFLGCGGKKVVQGGKERYFSMPQIFSIPLVIYRPSPENGL